MKYTPDITAPVVNINGTDKDTLFSRHLDVSEALRAAAHAMHEAFPHGRDYPTLEAYKRAAAQARERCLAIERLLMDHEALNTAISNQL